MAFAKQQERILAGGLNLVPASDATPSPDSLALQNFRIDTAGQLRSRRGLIRDGGAPDVHSLFRYGNDRFAGSGTNLNAGTDIATTIASGFDGKPLWFAAHAEHVWVMNAAQQVKVKDRVASKWGIAAPSSAPVAAAGATASVVVAEFESAEGWEVSAFSQNKQTINPNPEVTITDQGTVTATAGEKGIVGHGTEWTPEMVGANIAIAVRADWTVYSVIASVEDATHLTLITDFDAATATGYRYAISRTQPAVSYEAGVSGQSLHIACNPAGRWQARRALAADLRIDGTDRDDDQFRLWVYASDPAAVSTVKITLLSGGGDVRQAVEVELPGSQLQQRAFSWTPLSIARRLNAYSLLDANPQYRDLLEQIAKAEDDAVRAALNQQRLALAPSILAATPHFADVGREIGTASEFDWATVTELWVEVTTTSPCDVHFDKAEMVGGVESSLEGEFSWFVTFANDDGHESNPSPAAEAVELRKQSCALSQIPVSDDPQVTRRHIYGIGGSLLSPYRFATIPDNVRTTFTVAVPIDRVQNLGIRLPEGNDPPPSATGVCGPHLGRLFAWHRNRLYWAKVGQPWCWPGSDDDAEGNWIDVGDDGEDILRCTFTGRTLTIYKERSIHRLSGDPDTNDPERTSAAVSAVGPQAIANDGSIDYFVGAQGVYRWNGDREQKLSHKLDPLFQAERTRIGFEVTTQPVELEALAACVLAVRFGKLYLSYPEAGQTAPSAVLVGNLETGDWAQMRYVGPGGFTALSSEGQGNALLGANAWGLYELEEGVTDAGSTIPVVWQSRFYDQGIPDNDKCYADLVIDAQTADPGEDPSDLVLKVGYANGSKPWLTLGVIRSRERQPFLFPLGENGIGPEERNVCVRIEGTVTSAITIYAAYLHWYPVARKALTYDSGVIDLAGDLGAVEFECTLTGPLNWAVYTDFPAGQLSPATSGLLPLNQARVREVRFDEVLRGRRGRVVAWSDYPFQMHRVRVREARGGVLLQGGEGWSSPTVAIG